MVILLSDLFLDNEDLSRWAKIDAVQIPRVRHECILNEGVSEDTQYTAMDWGTTNGTVSSLPESTANN